MEYKRIRIRKNGAPNVLETETIQLKPNKKKGLLIEVWAFGVGWADIMAQRGGYALAPKKPFTPGYDFVGRIIDSYDSKQFNSGDMVAACLPKMGTYSEILEVPEKYLVRIPKNTPIDLTAASILNYLTAYCVLDQKTKISDSATVYIQGVSGGVGIALAQLGKLKSLRMYGTCSAEKTEMVAKLGVIPIDYKSQNARNILAHDFPEGIDAAFDARGGQSLRDCIDMLKRGGKVISYGFSGETFGGNQEILKGLTIALKNRLSFNGIRIKFCGTPSEIKNNNDWYKNTLQRIFEQINSNEICPPIGCVLPFDKIVEAHTLMEDGKTEGKIIVTTKFWNP